MRQTQQSFTLFRRIAAVPYLKTAQTGLRQTFDLRIGQQHTVAPGLTPPAAFTASTTRIAVGEGVGM